MGVIQTSEKVDPFAAASKYSTLIGCMTVWVMPLEKK